MDEVKPPDPPDPDKSPEYETETIVTITLPPNTPDIEIMDAEVSKSRKRPAGSPLITQNNPPKLAKSVNGRQCYTARDNPPYIVYVSLKDSQTSGTTLHPVKFVTRKDRKVSNIKAAVAIFDKFIEDFDARRVIKQNNPYLSLDTVRTVEELAGDNITELQKAFIAAYSGVRGEHQRLRNVRAQGEDTTWDIVRNRELKTLKRKLAHAELFEDDGEPTEEHIEMLLWAYSPDRKRLWEHFHKPRVERERYREIDIDLQMLETCNKDDQSDKGRRRSKRITEKTISNMKEAVATLEKSLQELKAQSKQNPYMSLDVVKKAKELAGHNITELQKSFIAAYSQVSGEYKRLRSVRAQAEDSTWDVVRNRELRTLKEKHAGAKLFTDDDAPTTEHIEMLLWAYSPEPKRVAKELHFFDVKEKGEKESEGDKEDKSVNSDKRDKKDRKRQNSSDRNKESGRMLRRSKRIKK